MTSPFLEYDMPASLWILIAFTAVTAVLAIVAFCLILFTKFSEGQCVLAFLFGGTMLIVCIVAGNQLYQQAIAVEYKTPRVSAELP